MTFVQNDGTLISSGLLAKELLAHRFQAQDGELTDLGGGCGPGGTAHATCGLSGTLHFGVGLRGAAPLTPAILVLGPQSQPFDCGPCRLVPRPLFLVPSSTDAQGSASHSLPLPASVALPGLDILAQWIVRAPGPCATVGSSLSNAIQVTVE